MNKTVKETIEQDVLLKIENLEKTFIQGERELNIFQNLSMKLEKGELVALVGQSGSGKSTLLQIAGLLDTPTSGRITIDKKLIGPMSDKERTALRRDFIGFVYQFHHLLPEFNALENVALPLIISGKRQAEAHAKADDLLTSLGLGDRVYHRPAQLSGGEQQRVAIARALANDPKLLFADEPTGNLDPKTSEEVFNILLEQTRERGIGALIATHNHKLADDMDRGLELRNGKIAHF